MLTRWGVVNAVDTGSGRTTRSPFAAASGGEIPGPRIMIMGAASCPWGSPYTSLPARLPELPIPRAPPPWREQLLGDPGVDGVKLFTGSWATRDRIVVMPTDVVRAAVEAAHRRGKPVFAHPSNSAGALAALEGGVDVLAHTFPAGPAWDRALPRRMREASLALGPTHQLWHVGSSGAAACRAVAIERTQAERRGAAARVRGRGRPGSSSVPT
jgi:hypothetical protein